MTKYLGNRGLLAAAVVMALSLPAWAVMAQGADPLPAAADLFVRASAPADPLSVASNPRPVALNQLSRAALPADPLSVASNARPVVLNQLSRAALPADPLSVASNARPVALNQLSRAALPADPLSVASNARPVALNQLSRAALPADPLSVASSARPVVLNQLSRAALPADPLSVASNARPVAIAPLPHAATPVARLDLSGLSDGGSYDRFIVTYRDGSTQATQRGAAVQSVDAALARAGLNKAARLASGATLKAASASYQRRLASGADLLRTSRKLDRAEAAALIRQIAADPAVRFVEPDLLRHAVRDIRAPAALAAAVTPNDPYYAKYQWHLQTPDGAADGFGTPNRGGSNVNNAWELADGSGIVIAVLDTGMTTHVDANTALGDAGYDFISDAFVSGRAADGRVPGGWDTGDWTNTAPWVDDSGCVNANRPAEPSSWHGTHVANTAGAELTDNAVGMAGIAHGAQVLPVRVLGHCGGYDSDINDAIVWAAGGHVDGVPDNTHPAQVINLSLGGGGSCDAASSSAQAIAQARALGAVVVVAAGNNGEDAANHSPASCPGVITVAATGVTSRRAYYSNYGSLVEIAAPGGGVYANDASSGSQVNDGFVWQALNSGETTPVPDDSSYGGYAGTSQATPHVAGTVALMQSARLAAGQALLSPDEVLAVLQASATAPAVPPSSGQSIGAGIVNARAAVEQAVNGGGEPSPAVPLVNGAAQTGQSGAAGSVTTYTLEVPAGASGLSLRSYGGQGNVSLYVKRGAPATASDHDAKSTRPGNNEAVVVPHPAAGTWYLTVVGESAYSGVTVLGRYIAPR